MNKEELYIYKWAKYSVVLFLVLSVDEILLIGNGIPVLQGIKVWVSSNFSMFKIDMVYLLMIVSRYQSDLSKNHWKIV